jgi:choline dehydrogenase-like flavoprotein
MNALGVETNREHLAGSNLGAWTNLGSVDPSSGERSYSATAYYLPNASRPNLVLLTEAQVTEIVMEQEDGEWSAIGVRFLREGESSFVAASHEVIVSAGSVQSPHLLELSGIGHPDILAEAGIAVKVNNPNVGENLQDHISEYSCSNTSCLLYTLMAITVAAMIFEVDSTLSTPDDLKQDQNAAASAREQFLETRSGPLTILPNSICYVPLSHIAPDRELQALAEEASTIMTIPVDERIIRQRRLDPLAAVKLGQVEFIFDLGNWSPYFLHPPSPNKKYATCLQILQYPFSRGSIHISPSHPKNGKPVIDPRYYGGFHGGAIDLSLMVHAARFASDRIAKTPPLVGIIRQRVFPPPSPMMEDGSFWKDWLSRTTITDWHPVGTCAMGGRARMSAEGGGVVDERLRVYRTKGLRVVDASVMPLQISAHLQATVYAIGEKGAAMILEDRGLDGK